ncbi:enoyl-CoA hydratase-related protein [Zhongshania aquimaris]|uniref:Enoyl-CoA hydratase/isomerase family protein n=1 Tax=Zhongshania aquimaris TaxID=2857107 RepID=A0ABS6VSW0_9GAMM|nr:enoyl-CoA hydratase-related protein [Zhongshania aquimaris]MBW2941361.1 enoyl-CoA hydratase/isomerase family protein [Zhongshania aquimaris]
MTHEASEPPNEILTSLSENILTITLNRVQKKNALSYAMYDSLIQLLNDAEENRGIKVVILTASGDYFTAGNDIGAFQNSAEMPYNEKSSFHFMNTLASFKKPIIAAVNGHAIGIGVTLLLHCDLIYASDSCSFKMPFLTLGLVPEFASTMILPERLGRAKAVELLMIGDQFDSNQAVSLGIVNKALPADELLSYAYHNAQILASKPTAALLATKRLMTKRLQQQTLAAIDEEALEFSTRLRSAETQSIVSKFLNKRRS